MGMELVSGLSLVSPLARPIFGLTQMVQWASLSQEGFGTKDSERLAGHIMDWHLFPPLGPSQILRVFGGTTTLELPVVR